MSIDLIAFQQKGTAMIYLAHISDDGNREQSIKSHLEETALSAKKLRVSLATVIGDVLRNVP